MRTALLLLLALLAACDGPSAARDIPTDWGVLSIDDAGGLLDAPDVQFVDTRGEAPFVEGHVPGAVRIEAGQLRATIDGVDGQVPPRAEVEDVLREVGLAADLPTVVYGAGNDTGPARVLWTLAYYGADGPLMLMDGGWEAWARAGYDEEVGAVLPTDQPWAGAATDARLRVDKAWMLDHLDDPDVTIYDVRSAEEYAAGHVPGAISVDWMLNLDEDGRFRSNAEVLELHGDPTAATVVVYSQSGSRASVAWSLLTFAGLADVRLYDGSWNEWGIDPDTPKATTEG